MKTFLCKELKVIAVHHAYLPRERVLNSCMKISDLFLWVFSFSRTQLPSLLSEQQLMKQLVQLSLSVESFR